MIDCFIANGSIVIVVNGIIINRGKKALIKTEELTENHTLNTYGRWDIKTGEPGGSPLLFIYGCKDKRLYFNV